MREEFDVRAFECASGTVYLVLVKGDLGDGRSVLTRVHSECLTGDALGSLRCDCGLQLQMAFRAIAAEGRGVLVYATGHEGRGIGLVNKLRAYMLQEAGSDTVDANHLLGFPADARDYGDAARCLALAGVRSVRLLTNNPAKVEGLEANGIEVEGVVPIATSPHTRNERYLRAKRHRLGHVAPAGEPAAQSLTGAADVSALLGDVRDPGWRPYVVLKYAQTLDGRIATRTGDSKWISGEEERSISHALRAACDAILVGVGTVVTDDPELTVRMVPGVSPVRVVLDSTLRVPLDAKVLGEDALTMVIATERAALARRVVLQGLGVAVRIVDSHRAGVDAVAALRLLREVGHRTLLVEGGARVATTLLRAGLVDRLVVAIAPRIIGTGTDAVGDLSVLSITDGLRIRNQLVFHAGDDLLLAGDLDPAPAEIEEEPRALALAGPLGMAIAHSEPEAL